MARILTAIKSANEEDISMTDIKPFDGKVNAPPATRSAETNKASITAIMLRWLPTALFTKPSERRTSQDENTKYRG